ncbi:hypothetical protein K9B33_19565 [Sphingobium sp. 3R8]|uniref:ThiF family adenylyltransferase n=1 Tax=Sphingobium sp. 3R8 TaxID=2874921 RepID=UPI001CCDAF74|nr:ThiF family adenylyltransferase [Sphingobium sp. 3R8]MBZ9649740.1 hypothetical protein [Sphingobium sp. 3R8]
MINPQQENARMLASLIGVNEDEAAERLDRTVLITSASDEKSQSWASEICALLERTINVTFVPSNDAVVELVVGDVEARATVLHLYGSIDRQKAVIDAEPVSVSNSSPHGLFAAIAACQVAAATLSKAIDSQGIPATALPLTIRLTDLGITESALETSLNLEDAVLIGAGAVGHGFVRALRHVHAKGLMPIVDPKKVGGGNLNRCLYLQEADVGVDKAVALTRNAQADLQSVTLQPFVGDFHEYVALNGMQHTVMVTVDSRRVRRSIQAEVPGRVFDASTTDIRSVVVHSHELPTDRACLSCIYKHVDLENVRERAIADGLGIDIAMVKENLITPAAATLIALRYPEHPTSAFVGMAYDSLFKQLCAEQALSTPEGRQVLAPFAFVSNLAGALIVLEMLRSKAGLAATNYWQVDPWGRPIDRLRTLRYRIADCEFCSRPHVRDFVDQIWGASPPKPI